MDRDLMAAERGIGLPIPFGWYVLAYSDELGVGAVMPLRYFGKDLVLWRGEDGKPRALDAYCRHLGAHMGYGGKVAGNALECPFHAWRYDETGAVIEIPYAKKIPPQVRKPCIGSWPVVERNRMIWGWYHPHHAAPQWEVAELPETSDPAWGDYDRYEWQVGAHLQDLAENGVDPAHFRFVHGTASFPDWELGFDGIRRTGTLEAKMQTPRGPVDGTIASVSIGPGQSWTRFAGICDTLLVAGITPVERDRVHVRFAFTQPRAQKDGPGAGVARAIIRDLTHQLDQDKVIWDHKIHESKPILCDGDGPIAKFREHYRQFYAELAEASPTGKNGSVAKFVRKA